MSNPRHNTQTANTREASTQKIGSYGRGQNDAPDLVVVLQQQDRTYDRSLHTLSTQQFIVRPIVGPVTGSNNRGWGSEAALPLGLSRSASLTCHSKPFIPGFHHTQSVSEA